MFWSFVQADRTTVDYSLANPDTLTKYKTAAQISHRVLEAVTDWCVEGAKILTICEKGDKLLDEEIAKVYKGKKIAKGQTGLFMQIVRLQI
jgi:methionine aminopeptidase